MPSLCLGTAQFGLAYGATNTHGKISEHTVSNILSKASSTNIKYLDTAQSYGNSETVLGKQLPPTHNFRIINKLPKQSKKYFAYEDIDFWETEFQSSLAKLRISNFDSFLLHSSDDLRKPGSHYLKSWLLSLKTRGLSKRLGVSIYSSKDLDHVDHSLLDIVQLPLSLYDQRLLRDGTISRLNTSGIAIHARSVYLQGLLVSPSSKWPKWANSDLRSHHLRLEHLANEKECSLLNLALGFALGLNELEAIVIGVTDELELQQLLISYSKSSCWSHQEWSGWHYYSSEACLDPRTWPT